MSIPTGVRALLLDIEGTTTPISFVYEILFPFARRRLEEACGEAESGSPLAAAIDLLRDEHEIEKNQGAEDLPKFGTGVPYAAYLMDRDRKSTGLKALQGLIWQEGYKAGTLRGQVFPDVLPALERWQKGGLRTRIFSSGSVQAQKLLFSYSQHGDLTRFFEGYHDTTTGPKKEPSSYVAIATAFELEPSEILFLSDVVDELDAARAAGMATGLLVRPGNHPVSGNTHPTYQTFDQLD